MATTSLLKGSSYKPSKGGYAPGDLRDAFIEAAVEAFKSAPGDSEPTVELRGQQVSISQIFGLLWNCVGIVPGWVMDEIRLRAPEAEIKGPGSYGAAARWLNGLTDKKKPLSRGAG